jgi:hypothetical protein
MGLLERLGFRQREEDPSERYVKALERVYPTIEMFAQELPGSAKLHSGNNEKAAWVEIRWNESHTGDRAKQIFVVQTPKGQHLEVSYHREQHTVRQLYDMIPGANYDSVGLKGALSYAGTVAMVNEINGPQSPVHESDK